MMLSQNGHTATLHPPSDGEADKGKSTELKFAWQQPFRGDDSEPMGEGDDERETRLG